MKRRLFSSPVAGLLALFVVGAAFSCWMVVRADRELRTGLLQQTRLMAQAMDVGRVQSLSGTAADLNSPDYLKLKAQFAAVRSANAQCRFIYLMGRKAVPPSATASTNDSAVFFFMDSGQKDECQPGDPYTDASAELRSLFDAGQPFVEGPLPDEWGVWISAIVPIANPQTGAVIAVLGQDIDASDWKWNVATHAALPVGLMLVLLICIGTAFVTGHSKRAVLPKPVLRHLLPPLAGLSILMTAGTGALLWHQHQQHLAEDIEHLASDVSGYLHASLELQASGLAAALSPIANDARVKSALRACAADRLLTDWQPVFATMRKDSNITHFYFSDTNRVCLLRVHKPEKRGDQIDRFTAREAERTGKVASGFELGPMGTFTLRVVQPVFEGGALAGYVELGKEIADVLQTLHFQSSCQLAVTLFKKNLSQSSWEEGLRLLGRASDWDRMPNSVVTYSSHGRLPDAFLKLADHSTASSNKPHVDARREIVSEGKSWRVSVSPLQDASGAEVGDLLVMRDITAEATAFARLTALGGTAGAVLLALLLAVIYALLRRADAGIRAQQEEVQRSREYLLATLRSIGDGVIVCDASGRVVNLNAVAETLTGWTINEAREKPIAEVFRIVNSETGQEAEIPVARALREDRIIGLANHTSLLARNGTSCQIADSCAPIHDADRCVLGAVLVFRDVTDEYRQRELLRESEAMQRILLDNLPVGVVIVDPATRVIERVNDHVTALFGAPVGHLVGHRCHALLCPASEGACPVCDLGKIVDNSERVLLRADGSSLPIIKTVKKIKLQGHEKLLECFVDVSERKRTEQALAQTAERLSLATRAGGVGVWDFDLVNNRLHWDDQMYRLYGTTREQCADANDCWRSKVHPEDLVREEAEIQMAIRGDKEFDTEFRVFWPDGALHSIRALAVVQRDDAGQPQRMIGTNWDITVLRTQTEELARTVQELQLFNQFIIGRELVMIDLKKQVNDLLSRLGQSPAYDLQGLESDSIQSGIN